jgi:hypothetical protein
MAQKTILIVGAGEHIVSEEPRERSRETILLAATAVDLPAGTVLGRSRGTQTVASAARAGNTGNGTIGTLSAPTSTAPGRYGVTMTSATAFVVEDASGEEIGTGVAGTPFNKGGIVFTLTAGGTPLVANDGFDITVVYAANGAYVPINPSATDGSQNYAGHLFEGRYASTGTQKAVANVRATQVNGNKVTYINTVTTLQLAAIEAQAAALGVITRY